jgi:hypothetical protein
MIALESADCGVAIKSSRDDDCVVWMRNMYVLG